MDECSQAQTAKQAGAQSESACLAACRCTPRPARKAAPRLLQLWCRSLQPCVYPTCPAVLRPWPSSRVARAPQTGALSQTSCWHCSTSRCVARARTEVFSQCARSGQGGREHARFGFSACCSSVMCQFISTQWSMAVRVWKSVAWAWACPVCEVVRCMGLRRMQPAPS